MCLCNLASVVIMHLAGYFIYLKLRLTDASLFQLSAKQRCVSIDDDTDWPQFTDTMSRAMSVDTFLDTPQVSVTANSDVHSDMRDIKDTQTKISLRF